MSMEAFHLWHMEYNQSETLGMLFLGGKMICFTLELPWLGNREDVSRIPSGIFAINRFHSSEHGECFKIDFVPGRTDILIHIGNVASNTTGCILPGRRIGTLFDKRAVLNSSEAMGDISQAWAREPGSRLFIVQDMDPKWLKEPGLIDWR